MINILHIVNGWPAGGCIEQCYLAAKYTPKDKFKHYTIGYCHFDGAFVKRFENIGVPCIKSDEQYSNLKEVIDKYKIDIVHTQTGGGDNPSYAEQLKEWGVPLIHWLHCPRKCGIPHENVSKVLYTTPYTFEKNDDIRIHNKMESIQYALDLKEPIRKTAKKQTRDKPVKVGRLGRIVPDKRPDAIIQLAKMSWLSFGEKVEFHIAGLIPQDYDLHIKYGHEFMEQVKRCPNVHYHGFVDDKYDFWKELDICINPVWETSFDIVFLEAMSCGIPILTWNNSAASHVVRNAGVITPEHISSLYCGLHYLIMDTQACEAMGNKGIEYIKNYYSLDKFVDSHVKLYERLK